MQRELAGLRIFVVEDEALIAMMLEDMLIELGCEVAGIASRLDSALELARSGVFDAAVLDVNLDGKPVYPVAEALRDRDIPFLFTTGYGSPALREDFANRPVLTKPYQRGTLTQALNALRQEVANGNG